MNWKERLAKELVWLICTIGGVLLFWSLWIFIFQGNVFEYLWEPLFKTQHHSHGFVLLINILPVGVLYFVRLTLGLIKQVRAKKKG